ncbi:MAG: hypothetical protein ABSD62_00150 [Candidatus Limnocylindrales bacterium]
MRGRHLRARSARCRWIWLVAAVCLCAVVGACHVDTPFGADAQNDSSTGFIVELQIDLNGDQHTGGSFEVPAHTKGYLIGGGGGGPNLAGSTATLYTLDCAKMATLDIRGDRKLVYIDPDGRASWVTGPESAPYASPAATEGHIESVTGCRVL